jgi:hypothetical protein
MLLMMAISSDDAIRPDAGARHAHRIVPAVPRGAVSRVALRAPTVPLRCVCIFTSAETETRKLSRRDDNNE